MSRTKAHPSANLMLGGSLLVAGLLASPAAALVPQAEAYCFAVADSGDNLVFINKDGDGFVDMGATGTSNMEAIAFNPGDGDLVNPSADARLFAVDGDNFGYLDYNDAFDGDGNDSEFIQISADVGTCTLPASQGGGTVTINDVDGLQFDVTRYDASTGTYVLWGTVRDGDGAAPDDVLIQIDPNTGLVDTTPTPGFTGGATCVRMFGAQVDVDDIAIKPEDGILYAVSNTGGGTDDLVIVDPVTGATTIVSFFANVNPPPARINDMEGLSFGLDSVLYGTTGAAGVSPNDFWAVDTPDGDTTQIAPFPALGDYEAVACLVDNVITGTVFFDVDGDGLIDPGDSGFTGARLLVYIDNNNDGVVDGGDTLLCDNPGGSHNLACPITDPDGFYLFPVGQGNFVVEVDTATLPAGHTLTTDNIEEADFANTAFGLTDQGNDFGFNVPVPYGSLDVTKTSDAGGPVVQGQTVTYTVEIANNSGITHTGIELADVLPGGVAYVPQSTVAIGPSELFVRDEFETVAFSNQDGSVNWETDWAETNDDGSPSTGSIDVTGGELRFTGSGGAPLREIEREVDLTGVTTAMLSFDWRCQGDMEAAQDFLFIEASADGGGSWTPIDTLEAEVNFCREPLDADSGSLVYDISAFAAVDTRIKLGFTISATDELLFVDNVEIRAVETFRDQFDPPFANPGSFQAQDGTLNWATDWVEVGEGDGPTAGDIQVLADPAFGGSGALRIRDNDNGGEGVEREANLSAFVTATLSFRYRRNGLDNANDYVTAQISNNGGGSWAELARFAGPTNDAVYIPVAYDISGYISANTRIRFLSSANLGGGDQVYFDDVQIDVRAPRPNVKDNVPGGTNTDLVDGAPPSLVDPADGFILADGETLTVTFQVTVDNPLDPYVVSLLNTAVATSDQSTLPSVARWIDPVVSGAVGDRVWLDTDGDGVQDVGEAGIPNVEVSLRVDDDGTPGPSAGDSVYDTRITGIDGEYLFDHLPPGTYWVDVTDATVPVGLGQSPGNVDPPTDPIASAPTYAVTTDEAFLSADFGYTSPPGTAIIGDRVWSDADGDGIQDPGEIGIGGVTLDLIGPGPDGILGTADDAVVDTVATNADGTYLFIAVAPGEYVVDVTDTGGALAGYTLTTGPQSNPDPSAPVLVAAGDLVTDVDFGYERTVPLFTINDRLWLDADSDGVQDAGETGIAGVTVSLVNASGHVIGTAITDANGDFTFSDVANGDYTLQVTDTSGELNALQGTTLPAQDGDLAVTVAGANVSGINFGYNAPAALGDRVWSDADGNGVQDPDELGIGGVLVNLLDGLGNPVLDPSNNPITTTTAADGSYFFAGLTPGDYQVEVDATNFAAAGPLDGYAQTGDPDEAGTCATCDDAGSSTLALGDSDLTLDFGYRNAALADVSGNVFEDLDVDGFDDGAGEPGFGGVTLALLDDLGNVIATTITDANGDYSFADLPAGDYTVQVTDDARVLDGYTLTSGLDAIDVTVLATDITGIDFGYVRMPGTGSIGDTIWLDGNGDGLQGPNEAGLSGVVVELWEDTDGDGVLNKSFDTLVATTITDADGRYLFPDLGVGFYFADPDETTLPATTPGDLDETTYPAGVDPAAVIALSAGEDFVAADFGYVPSAGTAVLGDFLWYDTDGDGLQDAGEVGIAGVDVTYVGAGADMTFGTGDDTTATTTTGPDGTYLFTGLPADDYLVFFDSATLPAGYNTTPTNTGINSTYNVTVAAGDVLTHLDWGFDGGVTGSVGDLVWFDTDGDGNVDAGEAGIEGVTVNLVRDTNGDGMWDPDGADNVFGTADDESILATVTTDDSGAYHFTGVPLSDAGDGDAGDADYLVDVTDVDAALVGLQKTTGTIGTNDNSQADPYAVVLSAGSPTEAAADFGYTAEGEYGSISNFIWHDLDGDGIVDPGEHGIEGVTVELWLDDGDGTYEPFSGQDNLVRVALTDANGEYEFESLPFGDYFVAVTDDNGVLAGLSKTVGPSPGSDNNSQAIPYAVTLDGSGPHDVTADFGYQDAAGALVISGTVFVDADADAGLDFIDAGDLDGVYDPPISPEGPETTTEVLVQGATMILYRVVGGELFVYGTTQTDASGFYSFGNLPPADYQVTLDTAGTVVDGFLQTTQAATGGVEPLTLADTGDQDWTQPNAPDSRNNNFGFYDGGVTFTPVTLSYFAARGDEDLLEIEWQTATEVGHVGFNLWVWRSGEWRQINRKLIASSGVDSIEVRKYAHEAREAGGSRFLLEDVGVRGTSRFHGPFELNERYGRSDLANEPIDWPAIRGRHEAAKAIRLSAARSRMEKAGGGAMRLLVDKDGIYRVSHEQLAAAGLDLAGVPASDLAVLNLGTGWPVRVEAPGGLFGPGAFVEWVGFGLDTLYTKTNVYLLAVDPANALRVAEDASVSIASPPSSYTATVRTERNLSYSFGSPTSDPWYDTPILAFTSPASADFTFTTDQRLPGAGPASLDVSLWGVTDWSQAPDHHVVLSVNGVILADETFDGLVDHPISFAVPEAVLQAGDNILTVTLPGDTGVDFDLVNVESWAVSFERAFAAIDGALELTAAGEVFEVGGLISPEVSVYRRSGAQLERLTNVQVLGTPGAYIARFAGTPQLATYYLASGPAIANPGLEPKRPDADLETGSAELLIVSHADFLDSLAPLVAARRSQGWSVKVVDSEDVFEQFGFGLFDPQAIRDYVDFARRNLDTRAVLLVGGDTYDYLDYLGLGGVSFIPSLYARTGDFVRFAPADGLLADGDGDEVPDVAIGRFPVRTPADLASIIDKTLDYEQLGDRRSLVMAADDYDAPTRFDFTLSSEQLAARVPTDWQLERIYIDQLGAADARTQLLELMDAGPAVTSYMGHSGPTAWSFDGLFEAGDATTLGNAGAPMVVAQWGCWTTYYVSPANETLAHKLLLSGDRGAAAVLGATTLTEARSERVLSLEIFGRLFEPGQTLGQAILDAKRALAATENPAVLDVLLGWNLLGDPTLAGFDSVAPEALIFADGFESGDTSAWSVP